MTEEKQLIRNRYSRRDARRDARLYQLTHAAALMSMQERERALAKWLRRCGLVPDQLRVLEVGCGTGSNLLELIRFGFRPENLMGNDLLRGRIDSATEMLPAAVKLVCCDAMELNCKDESFDVVFQSTVFTSIRDAEFQNSLARRMWNWVAPGGGILWYDFVYDNPRNPDVGGVPLRRVKELFPNRAEFFAWRLTLAPPVSRMVTRIHPLCYSLLNSIPLLRTHVLCWIGKAKDCRGSPDQSADRA